MKIDVDWVDVCFVDITDSHRTSLEADNCDHMYSSKGVTSSPSTN